jgi:hypothetical protein
MTSHQELIIKEVITILQNVLENDEEDLEKCEHIYFCLVYLESMVE